MPHDHQTDAQRREAEGVRDLQAKLYRDIGISAVAAALHSISKPEPAERAADVRSTTPANRTSRAA